MIRRTLPGGVLLAVILVTTASAGGWGVITVRNLPDFAEVGKPVALAFTVMPHGRVLARDLTGSIEAVLGHERISSPFAESSDRGVYRASIVFPRAGDWVLTIKAGYQITLLPLAVVEPGTRPAVAMTPAERGQRLFVAKGCVTCHQNTLAAGNLSVGIGPALVANKYQNDFLARMLADPRAIPPRPESPVRMPDLKLQPSEIASLVAFINRGAPVAVLREGR